MSTFPNMHEIVPAGTHGTATVEHYVVSQLEAAMASFRGMGTLPGPIAILKINGSVVMSDTRHERVTNYGVVNKARGDVLIFGLGLGMILHPIAGKESVRSVTVVEKNPDVVALVGPTIPPRVNVVLGDAFEWNPAKGEKFDTIYFDIWNDVPNSDLWPDMKRLTRRAASWRKVDAWVSCWCKERARPSRREREYA